MGINDDDEEDDEDDVGEVADVLPGEVDRRRGVHREGRDDKEVFYGGVDGVGGAGNDAATRTNDPREGAGLLLTEVVGGFWVWVGSTRVWFWGGWVWGFWLGGFSFSN